MMDDKHESRAIMVPKTAAAAPIARPQQSAVAGGGVTEALQSLLDDGARIFIIWH